MDFFKSIRLSRPKARTLHGVEIKKMPVGRYLDVMATMGGLLEELLEAAYPGKNTKQVLAALSSADNKELKELAVRLLSVVPDALLKIVAGILGTEVEHLRNELTPAELLEVWTAFWKLNDMSDFFLNVRNAIPPALRKQGPPKPGYSPLSPAESPLASPAGS